MSNGPVAGQDPWSLQCAFCMTAPCLPQGRLCPAQNYPAKAGSRAWVQSLLCLPNTHGSVCSEGAPVYSGKKRRGVLIAFGIGVS